MPRKNHTIHNEHPYHVTARTHSGQFIALELPVVWELMSDYLFFIKHAYNLRIHAFVLMSNHFHLVVSTPDGNLGAAMNYFMRETSKEINRRTKRENQFYGGRYYRSLITHNHYLHHVYKYVYRNPVEAGLSKRCEDYRFSTLNGLLGRYKLTIPMEADRFLFKNQDLDCNTLNWLNIKPREQNLEDIRKALKRKEFYLPKKALNKKPHDLETELF